MRRHPNTRRTSMAREGENMPAEDDVIGESDEEIIAAEEGEFDDDDDEDADEDDDADTEEKK
jgi:hypothetical protein